MHTLVYTQGLAAHLPGPHTHTACMRPSGPRSTARIMRRRHRGQGCGVKQGVLLSGTAHAKGTICSRALRLLLHTCSNRPSLDG